jgi:Acetyltransferase (GNAT) domain
MDHFASKNISIVGLDAVEEQVGRYGRSGFVPKSLVTLMQRGYAPQSADSALSANEADSTDIKIIQKDDQDLIDGLAKWDTDITGLKRDNLWTWESLFSRSDACSLALLDKVSRSVQGYAIVRSCEHGWRIGPIYAENTEVAGILLRAAVKLGPAQIESTVDKSKAGFIVEVWPQNKDAIKAFEDEGFTHVGVDYHRMWLDGKVPDAQQQDGKASTLCYAVFDAGEG